MDLAFCASLFLLRSAAHIQSDSFSAFSRSRDNIVISLLIHCIFFHHYLSTNESLSHLIPVENVEQFDATRGFLKQLEIVDNVWIGLMRPSNADQFAWS